MRKYGELKQFILDLLEDGEEHSVEEILLNYKKKYRIGSVTSANVSTAISQLQNKGESIMRVRKGVYIGKMYSFEFRKSIRSVDELSTNGVIEECLKLQEELERKLTYELTIEEYIKYQKLYNENKKYLKFMECQID